MFIDSEGVVSQAYAINDNGWIVGTAETDLGVSHAFLYGDREMTDLGTLGEAESEAFGINKSGQIVGRVRSTGYGSAFLHEKKS